MPRGSIRKEERSMMDLVAARSVPYGKYFRTVTHGGGTHAISEERYMSYGKS
jgi:hypothetical protein